MLPTGPHPLLPALAGAALALAATPSALAATASVRGGALTVRAAPGERNVVVVEGRGATAIDVHDAGARIVPGAGCRRADPERVRCSAFVAGVDVVAGDGDDTVVSFDVRVPVRIDGGPGDDLLAGGGTADSLEGGDGDDSLAGGPGRDRLDGGPGGDLLRGGADPDTLLGGEGEDVALGEQGDGDVLSGGADGDLLDGGPGDDDIRGDGGDDAIVGGERSDDLSTGTGRDRVFLSPRPRSAPGAPPDLDCRPGDAVRPAGGALAPGCALIPPTEPAPAAWPVPQGAPVLYPPLSARLVVRRRPRAVRIDARTGEKQRIRVRVTLLGRKDRRGRRWRTTLERKVWTPRGTVDISRWQRRTTGVRVRHDLSG